MGSTKLFDEALEGERLKRSLMGGLPASLVSARHLIDRLQKSEKVAHTKFRAWLKAWKVVSGAKDHSGGD
jgi:hypothetical protein